MCSRLSLALFAAAAAVAFPAGVSAQAVITQWNFTATVAAPDNSPSPTTGAGTATPLGMTNNYTYAGGTTGAITTCDILQSPGVANTNINDFTWRVRGSTPSNGWNLSAPQYSQGAQFSASTVGYSNIFFSFDWYSTTHGMANMQEQYTLDGTTWNNINPLLNATGNDFYNGTVPNLTIDFSGIPGANNNPNFGVRLVSAYDPLIAGGTTYGDASAPTTAYNNSSGNWRYSDITFSGTPVPEPSSMLLGGAAMAGLAAIRRRRSKS